MVLGIALASMMMIPYLFFREELRQYSTLGYAGLAVSCVISNLTVFLPTSSTVYVLLAASVLDPALSVLSGGVGTAVGEMGSYFSGRLYVGGVQSQKESFSRWRGKVNYWMQRHGFSTVFLFALVPLPVFDVAGVMAGVMKMKIWKYILASFLGKTLKFSIVVFLAYWMLPRIEVSGLLDGVNWYLSF